MILYQFIEITYRPFSVILSRVILIKWIDRVLDRDISSPRKLPPISGNLHVSLRNCSLGNTGKALTIRNEGW